MTGALILASASPRRRALLEGIGARIEICPTDADETLPDGISARDAVALLSRRKAAAAGALCPPDDIIVAADTVVSLDGTILGKPRGAGEAALMLRSLSGATHTVYTGVTIARGGEQYTEVADTRVTFRSLTDRDIIDYVASGEPLDKAGAYGIQGRAALFVTRVEGDYYNVVGLPLCLLSEMLKSHFGYII